MHGLAPLPCASGATFRNYRTPYWVLYLRVFTGRFRETPLRAVVRMYVTVAKSLTHRCWAPTRLDSTALFVAKATRVHACNHYSRGRRRYNQGTYFTPYYLNRQWLGLYWPLSGLYSSVVGAYMVGQFTGFGSIYCLFCCCL